MLEFSNTLKLPLFLCLAFAVSEYSSAVAGPAEEVKQISKEIKKIEKDIGEKEKQQKREQDKLFVFDEQIAVSIEQLTKLESEQAELKQDIDAAEKQKATLNSAIVASKNSYSELAKLYFMSIEDNFLKVILSDKQPAAASRNPIYFNYLQQAYQEAAQNLNDQIKAQEKNHIELEASLEKLQALLEQNRLRTDQLKSQRDSRAEYLTALSKELDASRAEKDKLLKDQENLEALAKQMEKERKAKAEKTASGTGFANSKDGLAWPVEGKIIGNYGSSRLASRVKWRGLLIAASDGTPVKAVASGEVVFSDWLSGYGYVVIIDHGKSYMSLYGHNQRLMRSVGDKVSSGEIIAEVGNSGRVGEAALYFEIRHKGKPVNPRKWLLAKKSSR